MRQLTNVSAQMVSIFLSIIAVNLYKWIYTYHLLSSKLIILIFPSLVTNISLNTYIRMDCSYITCNSATNILIMYV